MGDYGNCVPIISSPISDILKTSGHIQHNSHCRNFEFQLAKCIEAYGFIKAEKECSDYMEDLQECLYAEKRRHRTAIMQAENMRQIKNGERKYQEMPLIFQL